MNLTTEHLSKQYRRDFWGLRDAVPVTQAQALRQKLVDAGNTVTLVVVKNANHNFKPTGGAIQPTRQETSALMADFFDRWLKE